MTVGGSVSCILGAGYSCVAGIPLARDLFTPRHLVVTSERSRKRFVAVLKHYHEWQEQNPTGYPEQYLGELYSRALQQSFPLWSWAVEYVGAAIASPGTPGWSNNRNPRYSNRINRPDIPAAHKAFWKTILRHTDQISVLTTNYDILIEQALRHRRMVRPPSPGCHYGGLPRPQLLQGAAQPFSAWGPERIIEMTGDVAVYKLHGSLSWTISEGSVVAYQDMRPTFSKGGIAAIIPPVPEKTVPPWLLSIWRQAEHALCRSDVWIVCGYSAPPYDTEVLRLLKSGAADRRIALFLMSPDADLLRSRWAEIAPLADICLLPGIPEGIRSLDARLDAVSLGHRQT
jgi:hypothetical protein